MITRRRFLKIGATAGAGSVLPWKATFKSAQAAIPGDTLDPTTLPKYVSQLLIPPVMPRAKDPKSGDRKSTRLNSSHRT